ncbi:hypothetical protein Q5H92_16410 [Hymenobacter sp. M29]|uniref:DUF6311 domain-containing protein n=1 Tax=Hymenobacter mellowenesis TaxID=3063995 RepID=A0ABT9ADL7_9BACT|nr:hypothetical protein [Hymenobacter sp. M29]MDO7847950.1 hypothetical protein [Hymenobacter sp. M29]
MSVISPKAHRLGMVGVGLAAAAITAVLFWPVLLNPNDYFFRAGGDALQSYYATAFYGLHDLGNRFTGMNYPAGEHFNYPNLQPLVALAIALLERLGIPAGRYTVGIVNVLPLLSLVATPVVMYAILRRTRMPVLYSGVLALLIGFMAPQVLRLDGHISLSYACFVPLLWYCIIRMQENPRQWRWYVLFGVGTLLFGAVMLYFLACGCFFLLGHVLVLAWQQPRLRPWLGRMVVAALLPLLIFRGYLWATDHVADRPPNPYGLLVYVASPNTVFTPVVGPLHDWWQETWPWSDTDNFEGFAYVGLVATATLAVSVLLSVVAVAWHRRWRRLGRPALPLHLRTGLWAGTLLLLLACGIPFKWEWFGWITEHSGPVKQFRSLGRFGWPFYYVVTTYTAYCLYRLYRYLRRRHWGVVAWAGVPLLLLWGAEAYWQVSTRANDVQQGTGASDFLNPNSGLAAQFSWTKRSVQDFQAILPIPYYNMGTDKFDISGSSNSIFQADKLSAVSGLPLLACYVSRASVGQALQHIQLLSSDMVAKELLPTFPNRKPILMLVTPDYLTPGEQRVVKLGKLIAATADGSLYELPLDSLAATALPRERAKAAALLPTLQPRPNGLYVTSPLGVVVDSFDKAADRRGRLGAGAFYEAKDQFHTLYDGPVPTPADTGQYEASVWMYGKSDYGYGNMRVKMFDAQSNVLGEPIVDGRKASEIQGNWVRMVVPFRVKPGTVRMQVLYETRDFLADDLLIRPAGTDVYYYTGTGAQRRLVKNTYPLTP